MKVEDEHHPRPQVSARAYGVTKMPLTVLVMLAALLALALLPAAALAHRVDAASRPTIVLVHGAWAGPAGWQVVAGRLQNDGYQTRAPALDLQSS
jgi:hypothetical protein